VKEYRHNSLEDLENQLLAHRYHYRHCLLLTDTVFSMDGDICPLAAILALAEIYNCMVLVGCARRYRSYGGKWYRLRGILWLSGTGINSDGNPE
jgi:hypothetical protein